jgi:hypothetical protein
VIDLADARVGALRGSDRLAVRMLTLNHCDVCASVVCDSVRHSLPHVNFITAQSDPINATAAADQQVSEAERLSQHEIISGRYAGWPRQRGITSQWVHSKGAHSTMTAAPRQQLVRRFHSAGGDL